MLTNVLTELFEPRHRYVGRHRAGRRDDAAPAPPAPAGATEQPPPATTHDPPAAADRDPAADGASDAPREVTVGSASG